MKFLCVECDQAMQLKEKSGPDTSGSLSVVFKCENCSRQFAMLTNAHETQMLQSLGVKIGPSGESEGKCPFAHSLQGEGNKTEETHQWTAGALKRLEKIPEMVRPMAKTGIEKVASDCGVAVIDEEILEKAVSAFGL